MGRVDREIGAVGPDVYTVCARRSIHDAEAGGKVFIEDDVEGNVLIGGGVGVTVAIFPTEQ